jgi:hypothetical protein
METYVLIFRLHGYKARNSMRTGMTSDEVKSEVPRKLFNDFAGGGRLMISPFRPSIAPTRVRVTAESPRKLLGDFGA